MAGTGRRWTVAKRTARGPAAGGASRPRLTPSDSINYPFTLDRGSAHCADAVAGIGRGGYLSRMAQSRAAPDRPWLAPNRHR